jgi:hypothetical protein
LHLYLSLENQPAAILHSEVFHHTQFGSSVKEWISSVLKINNVSPITEVMAHRMPFMGCLSTQIHIGFCSSVVLEARASYMLGKSSTTDPWSPSVTLTGVFLKSHWPLLFSLWRITHLHLAVFPKFYSYVIPPLNSKGTSDLHSVTFSSL